MTDMGNSACNNLSMEKKENSSIMSLNKYQLTFELDLVHRHNIKCFSYIDF